MLSVLQGLLFCHFLSVWGSLCNVWVEGGTGLPIGFWSRLCSSRGLVTSPDDPLGLAIVIESLDYGAKILQAAGSESEILLNKKSLMVCRLTFMGNLLVADDFLACEYNC